ncbi:MAG: RHS repeat domain-containing protein, partial [Planctomycetota bacterium]
GARLSAVVLPAVEDPEDGYELTHPRYEYEYDDYGNLITITDKLKQTPDTNQVDANSARETTFVYDHLGNQVSRKLPSGKVETKEYNEHGQLVKSTDFKKQVIGYEYNDRGLLAVQAFYESNSDYPDDPNWQYEFTYDNHGRRVTIDVNSFEGEPPTYKNYYDEQGRLYRIDSPYGSIRYEHSDISGQVTSVYTPAGTADTEIANYYDELGRLAKVEAKKLNSEPASDITEYTYNPVGSLETVTYPNGNVSEYTYNAVNRLTNLTNWQSSARVTPLSRYQYTLSPDGQRTKAIETTAAGSTEIAWTYDDLNRLIAEDYNAPGDVNDYGHEYAYDMVGNRLKRNVVGDDANTAYSYNDSDQLTWETNDSNTITYDYDDNGALVLRDSNDGDDVTYSYDLRGRLAQADIENGPTVEYLYNPDGIRVRATVDGNDIDYIIDPYNHTGYAQVLKEINGVTGTNRVYITGLDVVAQATGSSPPKYLLYDGHGSVRQLANNVGNVVANYHYDGYGRALNFNPAQAATQLLYCGEMYDSDMQQYYLRARWYNPSVGRFNRLDDFGGTRSDPQSLHKYLYAHGNPINGSDPSGMWTLIGVLTALSIGAMIAALVVELAGPVMTLVRSTRGLFGMNDFHRLVVRLANREVIDPVEALEIRAEATQAANEFIQAAVGAVLMIARALAEQYAYSLLFAAVTKVAVRAVGASVCVAKGKLAIILANRPERHHTVFKCAVRAFKRQRLYRLKHYLHTGRPHGLHFRISQHERFRLLQPTSNRTMKSILKTMGRQKWLDELGECYKWLEEDYSSDYKGIYECYEKAVKSIGGTGGLI